MFFYGTLGIIQGQKLIFVLSRVVHILDLQECILRFPKFYYPCPLHEHGISKENSLYKV